MLFVIFFAKLFRYEFLVKDNFSMKLYEEFKEYENLFEDFNRTPEEDRYIDIILSIKNRTDFIEKAQLIYDSLPVNMGFRFSYPGNGAARMVKQADGSLLVRGGGYIDGSTATKGQAQEKMIPPAKAVDAIRLYANVENSAIHTHAKWPNPNEGYYNIRYGARIVDHDGSSKAFIGANYTVPEFIPRELKESNKNLGDTKMKLHEEFKLYENMWESVETSAVVFIGNERNEDALLNKVAKTNPAHTTTVYSISDFLREYDGANREAVRAVKFYTDTEGMAELEKACANMPERMKRGVLDKTTLIEEAQKTVRLDCRSSDFADAITLGKVPVYLKDAKEVELDNYDRVPVEQYNQICKMLNDLGIKVIKGDSGRSRQFMTAGESNLKKLLAKKLMARGNKTAAEMVWKYDINVSDDVSEVAMDKDTGIFMIPRELVKNGTTWSKILDGVTKAIDVAKNASSSATIESLTESRSIADIEAEITRLQQELEQAKIAEKKASYGGNLPKTVWTWDIYLEPTEKGTWTGIENDLVFETEDKALDAAWTLLNELDDEGELEYDPDDYYVEAFEIPLSSVSASTLKFNKLAHLI